MHTIRRRTVLVASAGIAALAGAALGFASQTAPSQAAAIASASTAALAPTTYGVDPVHSSVIFSIRHASVGRFYGTFNQLDGSFAYDKSSGRLTGIDMSIPVESLDTRNTTRDGHLTAPDFFNAKQFPTISFKSTSVRQTGEDAYEVEGDLTLHGQTHPITAEVEWLGTGMMGPNEIAGIEARFRIDRTRWGLTKWSEEMLGHEVNLVVSVEARAQ